MSKYFDFALSQVSDEAKRFVDNNMKIANQIHSILEKQGKTQKDLAELLGKRESQVSKWLSGMHNFTVKTISRIEDVLKEKIITTPIQSENDFLKMLESADFQFLNVQSSAYFPLIHYPSVGWHAFDLVQVQFAEDVLVAGERAAIVEVEELHIEQHSYALVA